MTTLFTNVTALLMDEAFTTLRYGYVAVDGAKISYVGPNRPQGDFGRTIDCTGKVMMPGFVNCHTHIPMTLMRGYGGGCDLQTWLNDFIFPAEAKWDDRSIAAATGLGLAEMIACGVTCIADMYMRMGVVAQQVLDAGISANLCNGAVYFGAPEDFSPDKCGDCENHVRLYEDWHGAGDGQILVDASIHAEYTSCPPVWEWVAGFARDHGLGMHVHISETQKEHEECLRKYGLTPIRLLDRYGVWDGRAIAAHCVYTTPEDWAIMKQKGVSCVHNPYSNLKLGSGVAPIPAMLKAGVNVALGTDGVSSHNSIDLFADMKLAAVLHNGVERDPLAMTARKALEMATVHGAKALGRNTGRIEAGRVADLILVDLDAPNLIPCHDEAENLVFSAHGSNVWMNMARGNVIYQNGTFLTLDLEKIRAEVRQYALPLLFK